MVEVSVKRFFVPLRRQGEPTRHSYVDDMVFPYVVWRWIRLKSLF